MSEKDRNKVENNTCLILNHSSRTSKRPFPNRKDRPYLCVPSACSLCNEAMQPRNFNASVKVRWHYIISLSVLENDQEWHALCRGHRCQEIHPKCVGPTAISISSLSAQLSPLQGFLHFMPGQPLKVYRLFASSICLSQKEQLFNTCFLRILVASVCLKHCLRFLCKIFHTATCLLIGNKV